MKSNIDNILKICLNYINYINWMENMRDPLKFPSRGDFCGFLLL